ncbi:MULTISPECIES: vWA domain-containing protein [Haloarcula]|uniref:vWA domain-containing protein n=1 Tax=Haloarcula TaxID=2237 RepID=UPI0023EBC501|nr:VWA domain-containing protein [Halomicroarcula sp. XH51]
MPVELSAYPKKNPIEVGGDRFTGAIDFDVEPPDDPLPVHVVFCIDKSGSMSGRDIEVAREGLIQATQGLRKQDVFGVVAFSSSAEVLVSPTRGDNASDSHAAISNLGAGGGTSIMNGLARSKELLGQMAASGSSSLGGLLSLDSGAKPVEWVVLITDGGSSIDEHRLDTEFDESGITVQSAGIRNYRQDVIKTVAERTQGEWADVGNPQKLGRFFDRKLSEARGVGAVNPDLHLSPAQFADIKSVYHTHGDQQSTMDPEWEGQDCTVSMDDMIAGKESKVRLDLFVDGEASLEEQKILDATLETATQTVSDEMAVEIAAGVIVEEAADDEGALDDVAISDVMETALEAGPDEAETKIAQWEREDDVTESTVAKMEDVIDDMKQTGDEKEAKDDVSRVLSEWDDDA